MSAAQSSGYGDDSPKRRRVQRTRKTARPTAIDPARHLGLVAAVARRFERAGQVCGFEFDDLMSEGTAGLLRAIESYDPERAAFSTYATFWIRHAIGRALANTGALVRVPVSTAAHHRAVSGAAERIRARTGREATIAELAAATKLTAKALKKLETVGDVRPLSLDRPVNADGTGSFLDLLTDDSVIDATDAIDRERMKACVAAVLDSLTPCERAVIERRFFGDGDGTGRRTTASATLQDVADELGFASRETIRRIEQDALRKLRAAVALTVDSY